MSSVVSVVGKSVGQRADELDVAAAVEQHLGDAGGVTGAVVVEHDDARADRVASRAARPRP